MTAPTPETSNSVQSFARESVLRGDSAPISLFSKRAKIVVFLILFLAGAEFVVRGPARLIARAGNYNDYTSSYIGAKAWIQGLNPYSSDIFWRLWAESGHRISNEDESIGSRTPYPWTCLLILAPFSLLSPTMASIAVGLSFTAGILISIWLLSSLPSLRSEPWRRWLFIALCLALAPIHSGLGQVNISMGAIAFVLCGVWALETERTGLAGALFAFSMALKPPIGAFVALFCLLKGQWRAVGTMVATGAALAIVAIGRLQLAGVPWLSAYLANSKLVLTDPINSITAANPKRFQMINLQVLGYALTDNIRGANLLALLVSGLLLAISIYLLVKNKGRSFAPLELSAMAVVSLLPVYHRFYDATVLILPLFWVLSTASAELQNYRKLVFLFCLPFFLPIAWFLESLQNEGRLPVSFTGHSWWNVVVLGHEIWALLALAIMLVAALWRQSCSGKSRTVGFAGT